MTALASCARWAIGIALLLISPALLIFVVPFAAGTAGDLLSLAGARAGLSLTLAVCIGALLVARFARTRPRRQQG